VLAQGLRHPDDRPESGHLGQPLLATVDDLQQVSAAHLSVFGAVHDVGLD
jgi:hypothetical protein